MENEFDLLLEIAKNMRTMSLAQWIATPIGAVKFCLWAQENPDIIEWADQQPEFVEWVKNKLKNKPIK